MSTPLNNKIEAVFSNIDLFIYVIWCLTPNKYKKLKEIHDIYTWHDTIKNKLLCNVFENVCKI